MFKVTFLVKQIIFIDTLNAYQMYQINVSDGAFRTSSKKKTTI